MYRKRNKVFVRAEAALIAVSVFFCSILYGPVKVEAASVVAEFAKYALYALGYSAVDNLVIEPILQSLGWSSSNIQVDSDGNVILSESQMQELKDAIEAETTDANGNDLYGMYVYEATASFDEFMAAHENDGRLSNASEIYTLNVSEIWVRDYSGLGQLCFSEAPAGAVWIGTQAGVITFYNSGGTATMNARYVAYAYNSAYSGTGTLTSGQSNGAYCGAGHLAFTTLNGYKSWLSDGEPYEKVNSTYTGGTFTIPADHFKDTDGDGIPDDEDDDDDGDGIPDDEDDTPKGDDPSGGGGSSGGMDEDEGTVLEQILTYVKKIYHQVIVGNVVSAVDAIAQVMDTAKDYVDEALEDTASIAELGEALTTKFPFSLPSTLLALVTVFEAEPVTPVFEVPFQISSLQIDEKFVLDFSQFDDVIEMLKWFLRLIWIYGLIRLTPHFIDVGGLTSGGDGGSS